MHITELADVIKKRVAIHFNPGRNPRYSAHFDRGEVKESHTVSTAGGSGISYALCGVYGQGDTPEEAVADYARRIRGKILVFNPAGGPDRQEFSVPDDLDGLPPAEAA